MAIPEESDGTGRVGTAEREVVAIHQVSCGLSFARAVARITLPMSPSRLITRFAEGRKHDGKHRLALAP